MITFQTKANTLNIAILGDSMTWIGGENCEKEDGWTHYFKQHELGSTINIYARSGATWTNTVNTVALPESYSEKLDDNNVIYNQALRLAEDIEKGKSENEEWESPDLVIIYAGANDAWFEGNRPKALAHTGVPFSEIKISDKPSERLTLEESIVLSIKIIRQAAPDAQILMVTPVEMSKVSPEKILQVSDIIEETAKGLGCEVVRADKESGISHAREKKQFTYTRDGVHTNSKGAKLIAGVISAKVDSILKNGKTKSSESKYQ